MNQHRKRRKAGDLAAALGASHSLSVSVKPHGPFSVAALAEEVRTRLVSSGGRPSDRVPTVRRLVPMKKEVWRALKEQAETLSQHGRRVSPGQLAAILVEKALEQ